MLATDVDWNAKCMFRLTYYFFWVGDERRFESGEGRASGELQWHSGLEGRGWQELEELKWLADASGWRKRNEAPAGSEAWLFELQLNFSARDGCNMCWTRPRK